MTEPVITACMCTGEPRPILDEAGMPMLVEGVIVCPHCGRNPFGVEAEKFAASAQMLAQRQIESQEAARLAYEADIAAAQRAWAELGLLPLSED